jgi:hypothetical protein
MFREYRKGLSIQADVDSGPIVLGAGLAATGIGLSSCISNADYKTAADIHALANMWGLPSAVVYKDRKGKQYLFGLLLTGDAFLTWAYSLPSSGNPISQAPGFWELLRSRAVFYIPAAIIFILLVLRGLYSLPTRKTQQLMSSSKFAGSDPMKQRHDVRLHFKESPIFLGR